MTSVPVRRTAAALGLRPGRHRAHRGAGERRPGAGTGGRDDGQGRAHPGGGRRERAHRAGSAHAVIKKAKPGSAATARSRSIDVATGIALYGYAHRVPLRGASTTKLATAVNVAAPARHDDPLPDPRRRRHAPPSEIVLVGGGDPLLVERCSCARWRSARRPRSRLASPGAHADPDADADAPTPTSHARPRLRRPTTTTVSFRVRVDDTLYGAPPGRRLAGPSYQPYVVTPGAPARPRPAQRLGHLGRRRRRTSPARVAGRARAALAAAHRPRRRRAATPAGSPRRADAPEVARFGATPPAPRSRWMLKVSDNDVAEMLFRNNAARRGRRRRSGPVPAQHAQAHARRARHRRPRLAARTTAAGSRARTG